MIKLFVDKFGPDIDGKSYYEEGEISSEEDWMGRTWHLNVGQIDIRRTRGWFQMYFYLSQNPED